MNNLAKSEKRRYMSAADASCRYGMDYNEIMKKADWYLTKAKEIKGGNLWQE